MNENCNECLVNKVVSTTVAMAFSVSLWSTTTITEPLHKASIISFANNHNCFDENAIKKQKLSFDAFSTLGSIADFRDSSSFRGNYNTQTITETNAAKEMLENNYSLKLVIEQIKKVLPEYLAVKGFYIEKITDPDDIDELLVVSALTETPIERALQQLDKFNESWWMDNYHASVCVDVIEI